MRAVGPEDNCDYLIVGGGSAGCVLASRLSENPSVKVVLVEAGESPEKGADSAVVRDARFRTNGNPRLFWPTVMASYTASGPSLPFGQARVLGGGSAINGMHFQRGLKPDYDEWRQLGVEGWNWDEVLPFFKKVETDRDFPDGEHGTDGPVKVGRIPSSHWSGLSRGIAEALDAQGTSELRDLNGDDGDGYGAVPLNLNGRVRQTTADAYLTAEVIARANLSIRTGAMAHRLLHENRQVVGTEVEHEGRIVRIRARETIVCMGAIHSPAFLMRSGIGPSEDLTNAGVNVIADRRGVGANLINHPFVILGAHLRPEARQIRAVAHPCPMLLRYSSNMPGCPPTDMALDVWERTPNQLNWDPLGSQVANLMTLLNKVFSTGSIKLKPSGDLDIRFNLLSDPRDLDRMANGVYFLGQLLREKSTAKLVNQVFFPAFASPLVFKLMQDNWQAQLLSIAGAVGLSAPRALRDRLLKSAGRNLDEVVNDPDALRAEVARSVLPGGHVAGTCRMGNETRDDTVTDSRCRVVGVTGLRVVDASIFPTLMAAGTNLPVMMAAEKAASMILEDSRA